LAAEQEPGSEPERGQTLDVVVVKMREVNAGHILGTHAGAVDSIQYTAPGIEEEKCGGGLD
jgi:hypothetical protein